MKDLFSTIGIVVVFLPAALGLFVALAWWRALWLYPTWAWFVVPLGVPQVSFWHFTGLLLVVSIVTHQMETKKDDRREDFSKWVASLLMPMVMYPVLLFMAWMIGAR